MGKVLELKIVEIKYGEGNGERGMGFWILDLDGSIQVRVGGGFRIPGPFWGYPLGTAKPFAMQSTMARQSPC